MKIWAWTHDDIFITVNNDAYEVLFESGVEGGCQTFYHQLFFGIEDICEMWVDV